MKNTLVISGHTDLSASVANKTILETIAQRLPQAEIVRLDSLYPDFKIDAQAEQAAAAESRRHRIAVSGILVQRPVAAGALDGRDLPARVLARKHGRQTERQETGALVHDGRPGGDVFPRRADGLHDRRIPALLQGHLQTVRDGVCRICLHRRGELWCADDSQNRSKRRKRSPWNMRSGCSGCSRHCKPRARGETPRQFPAVPGARSNRRIPVHPAPKKRILPLRPTRGS